ncbi:MAG: excinuclease ABC subunit UvrB [Mariprofundaceae bacterium]|nr:excinuclease ABC subunit UvrB [Mariprofundaceae bacterium]
MKFKLHAPYQPAGSQPAAIEKLVKACQKGERFQALMGVTGSGKTFTMANVVAQIQKPTLVLAHNKTLAAQLYHEFCDFFPENRVEYFVSYYDYYQPESYMPSRDVYIEKDAKTNDTLERMRLSTTASLAQRQDVLVVASVSAIYGLGDPADFSKMGFEMSVGMVIERRELLRQLIDAQYERADIDLKSGSFRVRGDTIDIIPAYASNIIRVEMFGDEIERLSEVDKLNASLIEDMDYYYVYPARHFVLPQDKMDKAILRIGKELEERLPQLDMLEAHRLKQRTEHDLEMIKETGSCRGIENYSIHFEERQTGEPPFCLLNYFPKDSLIFIDESHQTIPQYHGMYRGDRSRKQNLVDYGFRLPCALDNRPLKYEEFEQYLQENQVVFVSATLGDYEKSLASQVVEQVIRPTGLVDPNVYVRPIQGQMDDLKAELDRVIENNNRALVTTLTKRMAEELSEFLAGKGIQARYLHSDIDTLQRAEIIRQLRLGEFDVLVGINLLREGLDIPEVGFIAILDADKEGFLRDYRSLIQTIGRAARNQDAYVVLYADKTTKSMQAAMDETARRRELQLKHNKEHGITPMTVVKSIKEKQIELSDHQHIPKQSIPAMLVSLEKEMFEAAELLQFEDAIALREKMKALQKRMES